MSTRNPSQRLKGQEVSCLIVRDSVLEDTLTAIKDFEIDTQLEVKSQGYLGEKTNRKDMIYNGGKFSFTLHLHKQDYFNFWKAVVAKAKRETPDVIFNITAVLSFPNGDTPTVLLPDVVFGPMPLKAPARGDYVDVKVEGECEDIQVTTS